MFGKDEFCWKTFPSCINKDSQTAGAGCGTWKGCEKCKQDTLWVTRHHQHGCYLEETFPTCCSYVKTVTFHRCKHISADLSQLSTGLFELSSDLPLQAKWQPDRAGHHTRHKHIEIAVCKLHNTLQLHQPVVYLLFPSEDNEARAWKPGKAQSELSCSPEGSQGHQPTYWIPVAHIRLESRSCGTFQRMRAARSGRAPQSWEEGVWNKGCHVAKISKPGHAVSWLMAPSLSCFLVPNRIKKS